MLYARKHRRCKTMGGAKATLCFCWERQKLPRDSPPYPKEPSAARPQPDERGQAEEDDEEVELEIFTGSTFVELREVREKGRRRSRSVAKSCKPCKEQVPLAAWAGAMEENECRERCGPAQPGSRTAVAR